MIHPHAMQGGSKLTNGMKSWSVFYMDGWKGMEKESRIAVE